MEKDRWHMSKEQEAQYLPIVEAILAKIERNTDEYIEQDLSDLHVNPYTLWQLLEKLGYEKYEDIDSNGWQIDFWIRMRKPGCKPVAIQVCGITFELILAEDGD